MMLKKKKQERENCFEMMNAEVKSKKENAKKKRKLMESAEWTINGAEREFLVHADDITKLHTLILPSFTSHVVSEYAWRKGRDSIAFAASLAPIPNFL